MDQSAPRTIRRQDYLPPAFFVDTVDLRFELDPETTLVRSRLTLERNPARADRPADLVLDGSELELVEANLDGQPLGPDRLRPGPTGLTVTAVPDRFTLDVVTRVHPQANTALQGLYVSRGTFCTQCEAEGFRRITYFPDRPDVMARYSTTIVADPAQCPVMLSNGNPTGSGTLEDGRHWIRWEDPFRKPSYLFALVAGGLAHVEDSFTTSSGRTVALRIYVEPGNEDRCAHAMRSLKKSMAWDEQVFGLEYDLDIFMIVAVGDFNMGAMENKGLNVFNTKYILARPETATDVDFTGIESVVAHEYFHNWTGNRVTCRDWFQLSLKEGLTVFRDQQFSADMNSAPVKRIADVQRLRAGQFPEDAGPMAHPVRPDSYIEINNFYTTTVYEKGAEVVRMIHTLLGPERFRRGMDLYFARHDGQAVTCDDFAQAMEDASGVDLGQFRLWYAQAGTPELDVDGHYDPATRQYRLNVRQSCPPTPGQPDKRPLHIPFAVGLVGADGRDLPLRLSGEAEAGATTRVLDVTAAQQSFVFEDVPTPPVPSLLRGFSAPVRLHAPYGDDDLTFLMAHDSDPFNRWESGQVLATRILLGLVEAARAGRPAAVPDSFLAAAGRILEDPALDPAFAAQALSLPSESYVGQQMAVIDPDGIHEARETLRRALARALRPKLLARYRALAGNEPFSVDAAAIGRRGLKNQCLGLLMAVDDDEALALTVGQFHGASAMTDTIAALAFLTDHDGPARTDALATFERRWRDDPLVMDKWFAVQAMSSRPDTVREVEALMRHPAFALRNPNKVYALIGSFAHANQARFHAGDGSGYRFVADQVLALDPLNPQVAARTVKAFTRWRKFDAGRQALMRTALERIVAADGLSRDVFEIASKSLEG